MTHQWLAHQWVWQRVSVFMGNNLLRFVTAKAWICKVYSSYFRAAQHQVSMWRHSISSEHHWPSCYSLGKHFPECRITSYNSCYFLLPHFHLPLQCFETWKWKSPSCSCLLGNSPGLWWLVRESQEDPDEVPGVGTLHLKLDFRF
jgi:hypothetical protein